MEETNKVFHSAIITTGQSHKNNLYDLLKIIPAEPLKCHIVKTYTCNFIPRTDKIYVPKRRLKSKVKTVRDIRTAYENEIYKYLTRDLETQQNYILKKIRVGSSKNESTQNIAKKLFISSDSPISRTTWQMLVNINPDRKLHPIQFVLWNGKYIQVNGSKGGNSKLICKYDLANTRLPLKVKSKVVKNKRNNKKTGLLRNSLAVKFKPGPLGRKKFLDDSHQKYHGDVELVDLPKVGLVIKPTFNTPLEATISNFLSMLYKSDGVISEKWAEFAVSVLGKVDRSDVKLASENCVTFDLKYKCDQHRILMRKGLDHKYITSSVIDEPKTNNSNRKSQSNILPEVNDILTKIIDAVEININQNSMFSEDDDQRPTSLKVSKPIDTVTFLKDKTKRKYSELDRLDVTIIRVPQNLAKDSIQSCGNMHCNLGCICDSIKNTYNIKQHCGREQCMFNCKCDFSMYSNINLDMDGSHSTELIPGIKNMEDTINMRLAKEEQKFHQTVIVTGEKNILLKSQKRSVTLSKRYETCYKDMNSKNINPRNKVLSIPVLRTNFENVEPWCMVHNLYKCFCKGKFSTSDVSSTFQTIQEAICKGSNLDVECPAKNPRKNAPELSTRPLPRLRRHNAVNVEETANKHSDVFGIKLTRNRNVSNSEVLDGSVTKNKEDVSDSSALYQSFLSEYNATCSRVIGYTRRKYSDEHYRVINYKIKQMEKDDKKLQKRMTSIINPEELNCNISLEQTQPGQDAYKPNTSVNDLEIELPEENILTKDTRHIKKLNENTSEYQNLDKFVYDLTDEAENKPQNKLRFTDEKIIEWIGTYYRMYKNRIAQGLDVALAPPRPGKIILYPWDFILSRYRERKNLFMISKEKPYRIFIGVHAGNPFFESCININEIRLPDLPKYPQVVRDLLTNATLNKDLICILSGLKYCWKLAGAVVKVNNNSDKNTDEVNDAICDTNSNSSSHFSDISCKQQLSLGEYENGKDQSLILKVDCSNSDVSSVAEFSKWFIMTIENDFSEIRFYRKGFYVKYESIIKSIDIACSSKNTVRLSSHRGADKNSNTPFGIYAIPNDNDRCVLIGPYKMNDSLGIETINSFSDGGITLRSKRTRGFWLNTKTVDNMKVIENPLSFMFSSDFKDTEVVPLEGHHRNGTNLKENYPQEVLDETQQQPLTLMVVDSQKIIKPLRICKPNELYHLTTHSLLKNVNLQSPHKVIINPTFNISSRAKIGALLDSSAPKHAFYIENNSTQVSKDLAMEEIPQIMISAVYSQRDVEKVEMKQNKKNEKGMCILKPEEINRRLIENQLNKETTIGQEMTTDIGDEDSSLSNEDHVLQDQNFETSAVLTPCIINEEICVISDDEDDSNNEHEGNNCWKEVLIMCTDVPYIGVIRGKQMYNLLSYQVPGAEYSTFYAEDRAFKNLNSDLAKIIGRSKPFEFHWKVIDLLDEIDVKVPTPNVEGLKEILKKHCSENHLPKLMTLRSYSKNTASTLDVRSDVTDESSDTAVEETEENVILLEE